MADHDEFFNSALDDGTRIKLGALGWFLNPWSAKLGGWNRTGAESTIWYVDGFAGAGKYEKDGELGSPLIAAKQALKLLRKQSGRKIRLCIYNVEDIRENYERLIRVTEPFQRSGVKIINQYGKFADHVGDIVRVTAGSPVLLFVDPWGFTGFEFNSIEPLLCRPAPIDIILRLHHKAIPRLRTERANLISATVGATNWEDGWDLLTSEQRVQRTLEAMSASYKSVGNFLEFQRHPIKLSVEKKPDYTLGFASRRIDAFRLWNDKLGSIERELFAKTAPEARGQSTFLDVGIAAARLNRLREEIYSYFAANRDATWQEAYDWFMFHSDTRMMEKELSEALRDLGESNRMSKTGATWRAIRQGKYRCIGTHLPL